MQSVKGSVTGGLLLLASGLVHAASTPALPPTPPPAESSMQQHLQRMVEQDYAWETKKRELANELELEKLRSEIRKLRGEDNIRPQNQPMPVLNAGPKQGGEGMPHILLDSNIGGLSKIAVGSANGSDLLYVSPGENFTLNGRHYQLVSDRRSGLVIKEAER